MKAIKKSTKRKQLKIKNIQEDKINKRIECLSKRAFKEARIKARKQGFITIVKIDDSLYKVFPNGTKEFIKNIVSDKNVEKMTFRITL